MYVNSSNCRLIWAENRIKYQSEYECKSILKWELGSKSYAVYVRELFYLFFGADSVVFVKNLQLQNAFIWENRKVLSDEENTSKHWAPQNRLCNIRLETH